MCCKLKAGDVGHAEEVVHSLCNDYKTVTRNAMMMRNDHNSNQSSHNITTEVNDVNSKSPGNKSNVHDNNMYTPSKLMYNTDTSRQLLSNSFADSPRYVSDSIKYNWSPVIFPAF